MLQCLLGSYPGESFAREHAEGAAGRREGDLGHRLPWAGCEDLKHGVVLGIHWQHHGARGCRSGHEQAAGAHQALLVRERDAAPRCQRRERRLKAGRSRDRGDHHVRFGLGGGDQAVPAGGRLHATAGERILELAGRRGLRDNRELGAELARQRRELGCVTPRGKRRHLVAPGIPAQKVERARADRAGRAQNGDARHHKSNPVAPTRPRVTPIASATVAAATKPSSRSMTPPWPGMRWLASLTWNLRFIADSNRSPACEAIETKSATSTWAGLSAIPAT